MPARLCADDACTRRVLVPRGHRGSVRCDQHQLPARTRAQRDQSLRERLAWVADHGLWCPGLAGRVAHAVGSIHELTLHHVDPHSRHAGAGPTMVVCRPCNSAQGAR
jgi:hypothetical protein